jgi:hypothetical protein
MSLGLNPTGTELSYIWMHMIRRVFAAVALAALLVTPGSAVGGIGRFGVPATYLIEGYLDELPRDVKAEEEVRIGTPRKERTFFITRYRRTDSGDPWRLKRDIGIYRPDFVLRGSDDAVNQILDAPQGSFVRGFFRHYTDAHTLLIDAHDLTVTPSEPK